MKPKPVKYKDTKTESPLIVQDINVITSEIGAFEAKTHLSSILEKVAAGQTFLITKRGKPVAELRPIAQEPKSRTIGQWAGRGWIADDFDAPLEDFKEYME